MMDRIELEREFLSCCIIQEDFQDKIRGIHKAVEYFTTEEHKQLFKILLKFS